MIVLLNPNSCKGKSLLKWDSIKQDLGNPTVYKLTFSPKDIEYLKELIKAGEFKLAAAGGDGTVNYIINLIMNNLSTEEIEKLTVGGIGLGSSNDFHKPYNKRIKDIPIRVEFNNYEKRDIVSVEYKSGEKAQTQYFIINASIGITAEANYLFNKGDIVLNQLKKWSTTGAIYYSAILSILNYKRNTVLINPYNRSTLNKSITNVAIIKNPFFSGNLKYPGEADYCNGKVFVHICYEMDMIETVRLLLSLSNNKFDRIKKKLSIETSAVEISSDKNFYIETDGEIISADKAKFIVHQKLLKVCK